jgi:putative DNA methylase
VLKDSGGEQAYADAVVTYLGFVVSRGVDRCSTICTWDSSPKMEALRNTFARQAIQMTWDFAEGSPFSESSGNWTNNVKWSAKTVDRLQATATGNAWQLSAMSLGQQSPRIFSTDPPYYDNVPYADLSDFFYVWLRRCLQPIYPELLGTVLVPKAEELVADPFRHGGKEESRTFFERGMGRVFERMRETSDPRFPTTIYYAFKQAEDEDNGSDTGKVSHILRTSTGWETFLQGLADTGWQIAGTWPMRTELGNRMRNLASNALASSIVLVCRPRPADAPVTSRRDFLTALRREMPSALRHLQQGNIAPVDLAQASIGPGMAIFTRYTRILESDGTPMRVRTALALINQTLDEVLAEQEGDFDADTGWAVAWFDQFGFNDGPFGDAETLCKAKNTAIGGLQEAGIALARAGKVRLRA